MKRIRLFFLLLIPSLSIAQQGNIKFIENRGQFTEEVRFFADIPGGRLFFQNDQITYSFYDARVLADRHREQHDNFHTRRTDQSISDIPMHAVNVRFGEKSQRTGITGEGLLAENTSYFYGSDPESWGVNCRTFEKITYPDVFPNIDLTFYSTDGLLKYDLILKKGADYRDISMIYEGQERILLQNENVYIQTSLNEITENKPYAYSRGDASARKRVIDCRYRLDGNTLSFVLDRDPVPGEVLVIDPLLIFSTYSGSLADNWGFTAAFDNAGNLYSGGIVFGVGFPATFGSFSGGQIDVGILKYDSTGSRLIYAAYIGGSGADTPHSLIVNDRNELIILGTTSSLDFPVSSKAYQDTFGGGVIFSENNMNYNNGSDIFITKLNSIGNFILGSTYVGGSLNDGVSRLSSPLVNNYGDQYRGDVNVDPEGSIYVASNTSSFDFPLVGGFQSNFSAGGTDGVVFKMNEDLSSMEWGSFIGGTGQDAAYSIKFDSLGAVFIAGGTNSQDFPTTTGSIMENASGGIDGFVSKISNDGQDLTASTYIGTPAYNQIYFLDLDTGNNVYVLGQTRGIYPFDNDVYHVPNSGQFIHKISNQLDSVYLTTVFGTGNQQPDISPTACLVNECGNIYVSGWGSPQGNFFPPSGGTTGLPVTIDAFQKTTDGSDFYLMVLERNFKSLLSATFFGGTGPVSEHVDGGTSRFDKRGIVYHAVCADCSNGGGSAFPSTPGAYSETNNAANCNNAAFKFDLSSLLARLETNTPDFTHPGITIGCKPFEVAFINRSVGGIRYFWDFGNGLTSENTVLDTVIVTYPEVGTYPVTLTAVDQNTCKAIDIATTSISVFEGDFSVSNDVTICQGEETELTASGGNRYTWIANDEIVGLGSSVRVSPEETTEYIVDIFDPNGCEYIDTVTVNVIPAVVLDFDIIAVPGCEESTLIRVVNNSEGTEDFEWDFGEGRISDRFEPEIVFSDTGKFTIEIRTPGNNSGCSPPIRKTIHLQEFFVPNVFTPNEDGWNQVFKIRTGFSIDLVILNRWGRQVFSQNDYQNTWTAEDVAPGVYYYEIRFRDSEATCNGWVQVIK
jgi:hypothetical protein